MISIWTFSSSVLGLMSLFSLFYFFDNSLVVWVLLEMFTFSMIFVFYFMNNLKVFKTLFFFFVIQSAMSFIWVILSMGNTGEEIVLLFIFLSLLVKMGLFPGHLWALKFFESSPPIIIVFFSTYLKVLPLTIIVFTSSALELSLESLVCFSLILLLPWVYQSKNFNTFLYFSSIFHFYLIIVLVLNGMVSLGFVYFGVYTLSYIPNWGMLKDGEVSSFIPQALHSPSKKNINNFVILSSIAGFPPSFMFWMKTLVIYKIFSLSSPNLSLGFVYFGILFYLIILVSMGLEMIFVGGAWGPFPKSGGLNKNKKFLPLFLFLGFPPLLFF